MAATASPLSTPTSGQTMTKTDDESLLDAADIEVGEPPRLWRPHTVDSAPLVTDVRDLDEDADA